MGSSKMENIATLLWSVNKEAENYKIHLKEMQRDRERKQERESGERKKERGIAVSADYGILEKKAEMEKKERKRKKREREK